MKRFFISGTIKEIADKYLKLINQDNKRFQHPKIKLEKLIRTIPHNTITDPYIEYLKKIIKDWEGLIVLLPSKFEDSYNEFNDILDSNKLSSKLWGEKKPSFYEKVVEAMRYDYVQNIVYPQIMKLLGVKTCTYCNAQYAFAIQKGKDLYINYEIDHWKPKSIYPFLSTSFYNLQPCCSSCNRKKKTKTALFHLYTEKESEDLNPMHFSLSREGEILYSTSHDINKLEILFDCKSDKDLLENEENLFQISTLYQAHRDVVEELIWKKYIYNDIFKQIYYDEFKSLRFTESDFRRFIVGNYTDLIDVHKRPLSQMVHDISIDLGLIKE